MDQWHQQVITSVRLSNIHCIMGILPRAQHVGFCGGNAHFNGISFNKKCYKTGIFLGKQLSPEWYFLARIVRLRANLPNDALFPQFGLTKSKIPWPTTYDMCHICMTAPTLWWNQRQNLRSCPNMAATK